MKKRFLVNKLVRDRTIELTYEKYKALHIEYEFLDEERGKNALRKKLAEESLEAINASSREELISELADITQIIKDLMALEKINDEEVETERKRKEDTRGTFKKLIFEKYCDAAEGTLLWDYCKAAPEKYPEIEIDE